MDYKSVVYRHYWSFIMRTCGWLSEETKRGDRRTAGWTEPRGLLAPLRISADGGRLMVTGSAIIFLEYRLGGYPVE